jgi:hypothetical protein
MIFPLNNLQLILSTVLYISLFVQGYMLVKFIKKYALLHTGVVGKLKILAYLFTLLLIIKFTFSLLAVKDINIARMAQSEAYAQHVSSAPKSDSFYTGYYAGAYTGHFLKALLMMVFQNIDLIFVIIFMWLLIYVFNEAIRLKSEQELTI